jgi:hypothetical protein
MSTRFFNVLSRLSPNCRQATHLISEAADHQLSPLDRIGLRLHLFICRSCRSYRRSVHILRELMRTDVDKAPVPDGEALPDTAKQRILQKLRSP